MVSLLRDFIFVSYSLVVAASGGTIFITKEVGLSFGPEGPEPCSSRAAGS